MENISGEFETFIFKCIFNEHVLPHLAQISTYQVSDWSTGPRTSAIPHDIIYTIFMTSHSGTIQRKIDVNTGENFGET